MLMLAFQVLQKLMQENRVNMFLVMGIMSQPNRSGEQGKME
jgi:hypothetical protein